MNRWAAAGKAGVHDGQVLITLGEDGMYYPDLKLPTDEEPRYGKYGRIRKTVLQKHRYGLYLEFLLNSQLESDLSRGDYTKR